MDITTIYDANDTMKLIGHQCIIGKITDKAKKQMNEIVEARKYETTFGAAIDMFALGYIYGKRAERARKKGSASVGDISHSIKDT